MTYISLVSVKNHLTEFSKRYRLLIPPREMPPEPVKALVTSDGVTSWMAPGLTTQTNIVPLPWSFPLGKNPDARGKLHARHSGWLLQNCLRE